MIYFSQGAIVCVLVLCLVIVECKTSENNRTMSENENFESTLLDVLNVSEKELKDVDWVESRKKKASQGKEEILRKIIPMLVMPFITQTIFLPMILFGIKVMLMKSIFLGKLAILFWSVNLIRNMIQDKQGQFYSHNIHLGHH